MLTGYGYIPVRRTDGRLHAYTATQQPLAYFTQDRRVLCVRCADAYSDAWLTHALVSHAHLQLYCEGCIQDLN